MDISLIECLQLLLVFGGIVMMRRGLRAIRERSRRSPPAALRRLPLLPPADVRQVLHQATKAADRASRHGWVEPNPYPPGTRGYILWETTFHGALIEADAEEGAGQSNQQQPPLQS